MLNDFYKDSSNVFFFNFITKLKAISKRVTLYTLQIELGIWNRWFFRRGGETTWVPKAEKRTKNKLSPPAQPTCCQCWPHWWVASALTAALLLTPFLFALCRSLRTFWPQWNQINVPEAGSPYPSFSFLKSQVNLYCPYFYFPGTEWI